MPVLELWREDSPSIRVKVTSAEWKKLIAPAAEMDFPVDSSTVDTEFLHELMDRPTVTKKPKYSVQLV